MDEDAPFTFAYRPLTQRMMTNDIASFCVAGINYKKTEASIRGDFAITPAQYALLLDRAPSVGIRQVFVLSTCNRTEIYGFADSPDDLVNLLCSETRGNAHVFAKLAYTRKGMAAVEHIFNVGCGLDSQILGDYEIVGQLKQAVQFAKTRGFVGSFLERLLNGVLQASKIIKNQTALSGGTVSVSFAAVQYVRKQVTDAASRNILLLGIGKIGRITCKNLIDYLGAKQITLINRTDEKARTLSDELGLRSASFSDLDDEVGKADIIIVATNAGTPVIQTRHLTAAGEKLIIDLSIPYNVDPAVSALPNVRLLNVDELSKLKDETVSKRRAEIPKAKAIIQAHMHDFFDWCDMRQHAPVLREVKNKLEEIYSTNLYSRVSPDVLPEYDSKESIQKVINVMATKMRRHNQRGCHYIEAINDFMAKL